MPLGNTVADSLVAYLCSLYPRWKATPELRNVVRMRFSHTVLSEDQVRAILGSCVMESRGGSPDLNKIEEKMRAAVAQTGAERGRIERLERAPGGMTPEEHAAKIREANEQWEHSPNTTQEMRDRVEAKMEELRRRRG